MIGVGEQSGASPQNLDAPYWTVGRDLPAYCLLQFREDSRYTQADAKDGGQGDGSAVEP